MNAKNFYLPIYKMLESVTPLSKDCGMLCGGACCKEGETERKGMILFPYEEKLLQGQNYEIIKSNWKYGDNYAHILYCSGICNRNYRPLACRIFPLTPYVNDDGSVKLIMNPLAKGICPLARSLRISQLEPLFLTNVQKAINRIRKLKNGKVYINMLSDNAKDFMKLR